MNTKTSYKYGHNFYDGSNHAVGRDSPGALLDMLAEVASRTLHSESSRYVSDASDDLSTSRKQKAEQVKRKTQQVNVNLPQLLSMPSAQLIKHFAVFTSDELKRQYSYVCALVPGCEKKYTSFASEGKARISIKAHLADHLEDLKNNADSFVSVGKTDNVFTEPLGKNGKQKIGTPVKKYRAQSKKPTETPNKENKEEKSEKTTNYLRKILSNEMNFNEFERQKRFKPEETENESKYLVGNKSEIEGLEFKVLGDHSYYEHIKDEKTTDETRDEMVNEAMSENIMLMVVESDGVHVKELPYVTDGVAGQSNPDCTSDYLDSKMWVDDICEKNTETTAAASKPKGKAKFIGTSKEEREMALILIERIKKKGNPTGSNLQCRICDPPRSFTAPTTLVSHYRSHAGIKPYECRICRSVFTRRHSLKYHMLIHQNQTRFTCADCGKKFRHPSHFREHRRRHTGESPFGCDDCGQRFKTRNTYKRHLKTRHGKVLTTTGELLCLTEEEFQKVQTNRKRKTQNNASSVWADFGREEDAKASESIANRDDENMEENEEENLEEKVKNEATIEDYNAEEETTFEEKSIDDENLSTIAESEKTRENEGNTKEIVDFQERITNFHDNSLELINNSEGNVEIVCQNVETIDLPFCIDQHFSDNKISEEFTVDRNSCDKNNETEIMNENDNFCNDRFTKSAQSCQENRYENSHDFPQVSEKIDEHFSESANLRYAYKINNNVSYQFHVLPRENLPFDNSQIYEENSEIREENNSRVTDENNLPISEENNSQIYEESNSEIYDENNSRIHEYRSIIDHYSLSNNNNSPDDKFSAENSLGNDAKNELRVEETRGTISVVSSAKNATFIVLTNENFNGNYLRIETGNNIVVKKATALSSIALPQK